MALRGADNACFSTSKGTDYRTNRTFNVYNYELRMLQQDDPNDFYFNETTDPAKNKDDILTDYVTRGSSKQNTHKILKPDIISWFASTEKTIHAPHYNETQQNDDPVTRHLRATDIKHVSVPRHHEIELELGGTAPVNNTQYFELRNPLKVATKKRYRLDAEWIHQSVNQLPAVLNIDIGLSPNVMLVNDLGLQQFIWMDSNTGNLANRLWIRKVSTIATDGNDTGPSIGTWYYNLCQHNVLFHDTTTPSLSPYNAVTKKLIEGTLLTSRFNETGPNDLTLRPWYRFRFDRDNLASEDFLELINAALSVELRPIDSQNMSQLLRFELDREKEILRIFVHPNIRYANFFQDDDVNNYTFWKLLGIPIDRRLNGLPSDPDSFYQTKGEIYFGEHYSYRSRSMKFPEANGRSTKMSLWIITNCGHFCSYMSSLSLHFDVPRVIHHTQVHCYTVRKDRHCGSGEKLIKALIVLGKSHIQKYKNDPSLPRILEFQDEDKDFTTIKGINVYVGFQSHLPIQSRISKSDRLFVQLTLLD